jgi:hypothetical protein
MERTQFLLVKQKWLSLALVLEAAAVADNQVQVHTVDQEAAAVAVVVFLLFTQFQ